MKFKREIRAEYPGGKRELITFAERNAKGEKIAVELITAIAPKQWRKDPYNVNLNEYIGVTVYAEKDGLTWGRHNPQITAEHKINFDYLMIDTEQNRQKIISDVYNLAFK